VTDDAPEGKMRLAKAIQRRGIASRRAAEDLIRAGLVKVNGTVAEVTTPVDPVADVIEVRGEKLPSQPKKKAYYVLNKPRGYNTTRDDPRGRPSVLDLVKHLPVRMETIGRLDYDSEGVLLLTNDGDLAHALTHPSREVPKRYVVTVEGVPDAADMAAIEKGVMLDDGMTAPAKARLLKATGDARIEITVHEGRNRLIRRMMKAVGHPVFALRRERFASISAEGMELGDVRELTDEEVRDLRIIAERKSRAAARLEANRKAATKGTVRAKKPSHRPRR
jgi:pseudouridine synthase